MFNQLGVIGCGLMGGSFALALKKAGLVKRVVGYSKSPSTTETARRLGVIDVAAESALLAVSGSDIVLLAVPVAATESTLKAIRHLVEPGVLVMDVGSTKRDVVDAARRVLRERVGYQKSFKLSFWNGDLTLVSRTVDCRTISAAKSPSAQSLLFSRRKTFARVSMLRFGLNTRRSRSTRNDNWSQSAISAPEQTTKSLTMNSSLPSERTH